MRPRNKGGHRRTVGNVINRVFESSGPEGKVRGTPQQIIEKYLALSRDAQLSGDRIASENYAQHAEHYTRLIGETQKDMQQRRDQPDAQNMQRQPQPHQHPAETGGGRQPYGRTTYSPSGGHHHQARPSHETAHPGRVPGHAGATAAAAGPAARQPGMPHANAGGPERGNRMGQQAPDFISPSGPDSKAPTNGSGHAQPPAGSEGMREAPQRNPQARQSFSPPRKRATPDY